MSLATCYPLPRFPCLPSCPSLMSCFTFCRVIKTMTKSNLEKGFICLPCLDHGLAVREVGIWRQQLKQRPWRTVAYWFAHQGFLSLVFQNTQDHQPNSVTTYHELSPHQLSLKNIYHSLSHRPIWWGHFFHQAPSQMTLDCVYIFIYVYMYILYYILLHIIIYNKEFIHISRSILKKL